MHQVVLAAALTLTAAPTPAPQAAADLPLTELEQLLDERFDALHIPGAAWAVVAPGGIVHSGTRGHDGRGGPVTETTPFLWGSVAKPVTATAVMTLVEDGTIVLDEPVQTYLPSFALADDEAAEQITIRHLLEQTSGIPEGTGITDRYVDRDDPYGEAVAGLTDVEPLAEPGARHEYTSANYLVLGAVVESVTGKPYETHLRERVLDPLGMEGTISTVHDAAAVPEGHGYVFGRPVALDTRYDQTGPSYGYLGGTVEDLSAFTAFHLGGGPPVVTDGSIALMHTGTAAVGERHDYGLGWRDLRTAEGTRIIWHGGALPGFSAVIALLPDHDLAVVVLHNVYGVFQDGDLIRNGLEAAKLLAGEPSSTAVGGAAYPTTLAAIGTFELALIVLTGWTVRQSVRRRTRPSRRSRTALTAAVWIAAGLGIAYGTAVALPQALGTELWLARRFAPDVGWMLTAVAATALTLVAARIAWAASRQRRPE